MNQRRNRSQTASLAVKRTLDIIFALAAIIIFSGPCIIIAFLIWAEDKQTPIFSQERIGKGGIPFILYKFRSMRVDAVKEERPTLCSDDDNRQTNIGRFIRGHHLDEFPQLWNVLKSDMSFVGYRPERRYFIDKIIAVNADYNRLFSTRPGLFSNATLYNGYTDTMEKMLIRLEMDLDYLENRTLWLDVKIIAKTAIFIISGKIF